MSTNSIPDLIQRCFHAYETQDREAIEQILSEDFTFSSPVDDHIGRETYFQRCWPNSQHHPEFHLEPILVDGNQGIARYHASTKDGSKFRNTEIFTIEAGKIKHVDVYFGSDTAQAIDDSEIKTLVETWAQAIERKDVEATASHFIESPVNYFMAPPLVADDPLKENLSAWFDTFEGGLGHSIHDLHITTGIESAWAHGLIHLTGAKTDGYQSDIWYRFTLGLAKPSGQWKIAHAHESVPFLMDGSNQAATHLKPPGKP